MATNAERETTLCWNAKDRVAKLYTNQPTMKKKLDKLVAECPESYRCITDNDGFGGGQYEFPSGLITLRKPFNEVRREALRRAAVARGLGTRPR